MTEEMTSYKFACVIARFLDEKIATNILRLMSRLEEHDDVQNVYSNFDISEELMEKIDV